MHVCVDLIPLNWMTHGIISPFNDIFIKMQQMLKFRNGCCFCYTKIKTIRQLSTEFIMNSIQLLLIISH